MHLLACAVNTGWTCTPPGLRIVSPGLSATQLLFGRRPGQTSFMFKSKFKEGEGGKKEEDPFVLFLALSVNVVVSLVRVPDPLW